MKTKQYVLCAPGKIEAREAQLPPLGEYDALINIQQVGICGSDIHLFRGTYNGPHTYPMLFGHEWAGIVIKIGEKVTKVQPGDLVTGDCSRYCGTCHNCLQDKNLCETIEKFGITIDGASAEYIVRDEKYLYKAPAGINEKLFCLCEPVAVAAHLIAKIKSNTSNIKDKKILVMGGGAIGLAAAMLLRYMDNCTDVSLYDIQKYRTDVAQSADIKVPDASVLQVTEGAGYASMYKNAAYDIILETTGNAKVFANCLNLLKAGGVLGCVGMIQCVEIAQRLIVTKALTIIGSIGGTGDFETAIQFLKNYPEIAQKLISGYFQISECDSAFEKASCPQSSMKIVLQI